MVTLTESAILSTPRFRARRASSSNRSCFGTVLSILLVSSPRERGASVYARWLLEDRQDVGVLQDEQLVIVQLELGSGVLLEQDLLADRYLDRLTRPVVQDATRADGGDGAL